MSLPFNNKLKIILVTAGVNYWICHSTIILINVFFYGQIQNSHRLIFKDPEMKMESESDQLIHSSIK